MRISVIGCGYVGTVTGTCLADLGHEVVLVDIDKKKTRAIISSQSPVFEPGLDDLIRKNMGKLSAINDADELPSDIELAFLSVGTPADGNGPINLDYIKSASISLGRWLSSQDDFKLIVVKSTVLPGTTEEFIKTELEMNSGKKAFKDFGLASNPEFLREGNAVFDFFHPDRIVVGVSDKKSREIMEQIYEPFTSPKLFTDIKTAEAIKYASNAFLATKISFANEIGNLCKKLGIDTSEVFRGVGLDSRINPAFFRSGIGFGGSCFPKDIRALVSKMEEIDLNPRVLRAVIETNDVQPLQIIKILKKYYPCLDSKKIGILGLAFKPNTDDIRDSRAIIVIEKLLDEGACIIAYDPKAMDNTRALFPQITYAKSPGEALNADAVLLLTEWDEFENLNYAGKLVIDGRRIESARRDAAIYEGVCW
ncbi:MAG: UDP-glucose/GDP-mannose dehydrogenase family protein [Methanotrichaceae archaeon]